MSLLSRSLFALAACCALVAAPTLTAPARAANMFDPANTWQTIVTPHFRVNFMTGQEEAAKLAAGYAEEAHELLAPYLEVVPQNRTELTLLDHEDSVNGFGFPLPNNQIFIYLTSPQEDQLMGRYDAWMRDILIHEYTHVLHMEKTAGLPAWINGFFGRSYFPNLFEPIFLIEGLAVTTETQFSHGGRGRDAYYRMVLRMAALENKLASIDTASGYFTIDHPGGEIPYIYGTAFYKHLMRHYGDKAPAELAKRYAHYPFFGLYGIDRVLGELTGKDSGKLWHDMQAELKTDAAQQADASRALGPLTPLTPVTTEGMLQRHPLYAPDGTLHWASWNGHGYSYLWSRGSEGPAKKVISKGPYGRWSMSGEGRYIYHTRNWDENRFTSYDDIFRWDTKDKKLTRLSERARLDEAAVSPDGQWVVAVQSGLGQTNLVKLRSNGTNRKPLTQFNDRTQFSGPAWHPTRHFLAASVWKDGSRDLYFIDPETGKMDALWRDRDNDVNPTFTPDGKHLVFSSDRSGTFNLYAYELATRKLFRVTNVLGGLIEPTISPDMKTVAVSTYSAAGWDVATLTYDPASWQQVPLPLVDAAIKQPAPTMPTDFPVITYDPLPSLRPKFWAPFSFFDGIGPVLGVSTFGQDSLMRHFMFGAAGIGVPSGWPYYSLGYSNETLYPSIYAYATEQSFLNTPYHEGVTYFLPQRALYQGVSVTFPGLPSAFLQGSWVTGDTVALGLSLANISNRAAPPDVPFAANRAPVTGQTNAVSLTYRFGDNYKFAYSISPEGGNLATLGYEKGLPLLGSHYAYDKFWADWRRYIGLPWPHHALAFRASGGVNVGQAAGNFFLGGYDSATLLSNADLRTASGVGQRQLPLRGYGFGSLAGPFGYALSTEYRFPLYNVQRGWGILPFFVRNLHGAMFAETGHAWGLQGEEAVDAAFDIRRSLFTVGAELRAQTHVMQAPTEVRVGIGQGLVQLNNGPQWPAVYFDVGTYF